MTVNELAEAFCALRDAGLGNLEVQAQDPIYDYVVKAPRHGLDLENGMEVVHLPICHFGKEEAAICG